MQMNRGNKLKIHRYSQQEIQMDGRIERQIGRWLNRQIDRQVDRQIDRQADNKSYVYACTLCQYFNTSNL